MLKKCVCGFTTSNENYKLCPLCGKELEIDKKKRHYSIIFSAEEIGIATVELTYDEAKLVDNVLKEASLQVGGYCGNVCIDFFENIE